MMLLTERTSCKSGRWKAEADSDFNEPSPG